MLTTDRSIFNAKEGTLGWIYSLMSTFAKLALRPQSSVEQARGRAFDARDGTKKRRYDAAV